MEGEQQADEWISRGYWTLLDRKQQTMLEWAGKKIQEAIYVY